ncbi:MAG: citrate synthase, partial [Clostridiales bacterium]|nr:citrate synthase [Clostridiales bacterium]
MLSEKMEILNTELLKNHRIDKELYEKYDVKRGLRDSNGKGVLTGLTEVSDVCATDSVAGMTVPADGKLYYQGYNVSELIERYGNNKYCFEITVYLLLFGKIPSDDELELFLDVMWQMQNLENRFIRDVVMKASNSNIMNAMQRCVLTLYTYDEKPDDISPENVLRQSLELINKIPLIAVYGYKAYCHFRRDETLLIRNPEVGYSMAENILLMLRPDGKYTELEAKVLSIALILHAEHGGGNNSTFTTHVVTSSGTDTYSSISASIGSLKGPRHGGANLKVMDMFRDMKENIVDREDESEIEAYLLKILNKEAFDGSGLIYGMGHAVYTLSDPREVILKTFAKRLALEKDLSKEFLFYERVELIAQRLIMEKHKVNKNICANVDFYSGFVYQM